MNYLNLIGQKDDDFGYILFSFPERRGETIIVLSRGNLYFGKDIQNWDSDCNTISIPEPATGPDDLESLLDCIRYHGQDFEEDVLYTIFNNAECSIYADIISLIMKLQRLISRELTTSEVKKAIIQIRKEYFL